MTGPQASRYLALLGANWLPPSLPALTELVTAHLARVPFENVSKLIDHRRGEAAHIPTLDHFLDRLEHLNLGGTCYTLATHFIDLLTHIGYQARLCGADMDRPNVHMVGVVTLDDHDWLVDVGYAAPFKEPLALDLSHPVVVGHGPERYVLHPRDRDGRWRMDQERDEKVIHGYTFDRVARQPDEFQDVIAESFDPGAHFLNCLRIVRHQGERSIAVRDFAVQVTQGPVQRTRTLPDRDALLDVVTILLGISRAAVGEACDALATRSWPGKIGGE